ncbi:hypothetical protein [Bacillus paranthracis]|uniref:hypothetical protein n=1 Tax=Bacillus paranthracis TaxID=2026186 RepID=UPI002D76EAA8|nr:hypothetical protein [Bacillus paranthracis]
MKRLIQNLIQKLFKKKKQNKKIHVIVFTETRDMERYFKLFIYLLGDKVEHSRMSMHRQEIVASDMIVKFLRPNDNSRGHRAHYVFNLTQNKEFDMLVAKPIERPWLMDDFRGDPKFSKLF